MTFSTGCQALAAFLLGAAIMPFAGSRGSLSDEDQAILDHLSLIDLDDGSGERVPTVRLSGANLQIVNGLGATSGYPSDPDSRDPGLVDTNGVGNLIVGYNELGTPQGDDRTGSHNIVFGHGNSYSSFGGIVGPHDSRISAPFASVTAGTTNEASGDFSSVNGGRGNSASGISSSVNGGGVNNASGASSSVCGGGRNQAIGGATSVAGGAQNRATDFFASVSGGQWNFASGRYAWIGGGERNIVPGDYASVSGGPATAPRAGAPRSAADARMSRRDGEPR